MAYLYENLTDLTASLSNKREDSGFKIRAKNLDIINKEEFHLLNNLNVNNISLNISLPICRLKIK
jgi:hypothetical protein